MQRWLSLIAAIAVAAPASAGEEAAPPTPPASPAAAVEPPPATPSLVPPATITPADDAKITASAGKGVTITSADGTFGLTLKTRIQARETYAKTGTTTATNELNIKTVRLTLGGHVVTPDLKYTLQLALGGTDFETGSSTPIYDAYLDWTKLRDLNVRVGQFFVPFDRARTIREFSFLLVDRQAVVSELNLDRDVGISVSSQDLFGSKILGYNLGVFGGDGRNRFGGIAPASGVLVAGRITVRPFGSFDEDQQSDLARSPTPKLAFGVAGALNQGTLRARSTSSTILTQKPYDYDHVAADLVFKWRGFSLLAEALSRKSATALHEAVVAGRTVQEWSRSAWGWFAEGGYLLTDHLELAGRYGELHAFDGTHTDPALEKAIHDQGRELGGGVNVYLNGHALKVQADFNRLTGEASSALARNQARLQLDATF